MKVLVTFAVPAEFAPWRSRHKFYPSWENPQAEAEGCFSFDARVGPSDVRAVLTGMGGASTVQSLARAFEEIPDYCISSGLAGGLNDCCRPGDIVVGRRTCRAANTASIASNEYLVQAASRCGARMVNRFVTVDQILGDSARKRAMASTGDVVEMESYFVLRAAVAVHVPAVAVRAISDAVEEDLPLDFTRVLDLRGGVRTHKLVGELARKPQTIPGLVRFGVRSRRAAGALADFLDRYVLALGHDRNVAESVALRESVAK